MNIEFDQEPGGMSPKGGASSTRLLLLVLLLLMAVFGYLFYFTDLIAPREEVKTPEPVQTSQVKQPIPPRPADQVPAAAPAEAPAPAAVPPQPAVQPAAPEKKAQQKAVVEPPKAAAPAAPAVKKEQPKPAPPAKVPVAVKQAVRQPEKVEKPKAAAPKPVAKEAKKSAAIAVKPKKTSTTAVAVPQKAKTAAVSKTAASVVAGGDYTLRIGEYVVPAAMEKDKAKVRDAGLTPVVKDGSLKKEPMIRLLFGEYADQETARKELQKLRDATVEGFVLKEGSSYRVYAGSYFVKERAAKERQRLEGLGYRVTLKSASVSVPTLLLTVGKYDNRAAALDDAARLKKKGLSPSVVPVGK